MPDRSDHKIRQLMGEVRDAAPNPHTWENVAGTGARTSDGARSRRPLAIAAVVALLAGVGGVFAVTGRGDGAITTIDDSVGTDPAPTTQPETGASTVVPVVPDVTDATATQTSAPSTSVAAPTTAPGTTTVTTTVTTTTAATTTTSVAPPVANEIAVSYLDPPPLLEPEVSTELKAGSGPPWIGLGDGFAVVGVWSSPQSDETRSALIVELDDASVTELELEIERLPTGLLAGPGRVAYGEVLQQVPGQNAPEARFIAILLAGDRAGEVIHEQPSFGHAAEPFDDIFGHGSAGVIDRWHDDALVTPYLDPNGDILNLDDAERWPTVWSVEDRSDFDPGETWPRWSVEDRIVKSGDGTEWPITIERHPERPGTLASRAAPGADGTAIYATWIGPGIGGLADYAPPTVPVIAVLMPDGTGTWYRLPEGWQVADSNKWGTLLTRPVDGRTQLALFDPTNPSN